MKCFLVAAIVATLSTCSTPVQNNAGSVPKQNKFKPPATWKLVSACGAKFYLPPDVKEENVQGIDSCVKRYRGENSLITLDFPMYSNPDGTRRDQYSDKRDFNLRKTTIEGQAAEVITCYETSLSAEMRGFPYSAVLYVPALPNDLGNLTIWTSSKSQEARDTAMKIFDSLEIPKE
jgi:hypothetical protein